MAYEATLERSVLARRAISEKVEITPELITEAIEALNEVGLQIRSFYASRKARGDRTPVLPLESAQSQAASQLIRLRNDGVKQFHGYLSPIITLDGGNNRQVIFSYENPNMPGKLHTASVPIHRVVANSRDYGTFSNAIRSNKQIPPRILRHG